jgi:hypothetical protein
MKLRKILFTVLAGIISSIAVHGQTLPTANGNYQISDVTGNLATNSQINYLNELKQQDINQRIANLNRSDSNYSAFVFERQRLIIGAENQIRVSKDDKKNYGAFLNQSNVGLIKLFSELKCPKDLKEIETVDPCALTVFPGQGTSYSFRTKNYQFGEISDIKISQGKFITNGINTLGLIASIGDVALDTVTVENENVAALVKFAPASKIDDVLVQESQIDKGIKLGDLTFNKSLSVKENTTYLLRSVAYQVDLGKYMPALLLTDKREDVLVVFRVVKEKRDGSVILLWKKLQTKTAPKLHLNK